MNRTPQPDWNPLSDAVQLDQYEAFDKMRRQCPVAYSDCLGWSLFRHEDVVRVLHDPETFSNAVSRHLAVPNGMDPPEHTAYRRIIESYFEPNRMKAFEAQCRKITTDLVQSLCGRHDVEFIEEFAQTFAVRVQCAFLNWPPEIQEPLRLWTRKNQDATRRQDRQALSTIAQEFGQFIDTLLQARHASGVESSHDVTASLMRDQVEGRPLRRDEIVSIVRNWTVGEVGTIAAALGILVHFLGEHVDLQQQWRDRPTRLPSAIEEILRIQGPLVASRRVTTRPVVIRGRQIQAGERITLMWIAANRDEQVFEDPLNVRLDRDPAQNLLYGAGIHVCPGAPLARLEMRVVLEELLHHTTDIEVIPNRPPTKAGYPAAGFAVLPLHLK